MEEYQVKLMEIEYDSFNWSVYEHEGASCGDRCFMVHCGEGNTGICMSGYFATDPFKDEDWADESKERYYVDTDPDVMINPDTLPILTSQELSNEMPDFDWSKGHSGVVLNEQQSTSVEILWKNFIERNQTLWQKALEARCKDQLWMEKK
jgi:hypothetical protein